MKKILLFFTNYLPANQNKLDEQAIKELIQNWITGWQTQDTQLTIEGFALDIDKSFCSNK